MLIRTENNCRHAVGQEMLYFLSHLTAEQIITQKHSQKTGKRA